MSSGSVAIAGIGIISPLGRGVPQTTEAIEQGLRGLSPLSLFDPGRGQLSLPVGQVNLPPSDDSLPRTHRLARAAARQAMAGQTAPPDAIVVGVTTGGMLATEGLLKRGVSDPTLFKNHSPGSVGDCLARALKCRGPVLTVSTACSSGAAAIGLGTEMIRSGRYGRVLAGGADSLCRLTYHGFKSLKIVDPAGARPLDADRAGMSVAEGAAFVLLVPEGSPADLSIAEIRGAGFSCDAYHPATPHPRGKGAFDAMSAALEAAGVSPDWVDYVNLHGTGTRENDLSETLAIRRIFGSRLPLLSSVKGATGHGLAAAGAIEAALCALAVSRGVIPGTTGCRRPDPDLGLRPLDRCLHHPVRAVLSNSLGFGGNNASLVLAAPKAFGPAPATRRAATLRVVSSACVTGVGGTDSTLAHLDRGAFCRGVCPTEEISKDLDKRAVRRLRRLPRLVLAMARAARGDVKNRALPAAVFFGTGWGGLSETHRFLNLLFESDGEFSSPTDFIGSVHNAAAGQVALDLGITGPNLTLTGGDASFEQALVAAALLAPGVKGDLLVMGADEYHPALSALFDPSAAAGGLAADGGGALCLSAGEQSGGPKIEPVFLGPAAGGRDPVADLIEALGGEAFVRESVGAILAGIPAAVRPAGRVHLSQFIDRSAFRGPVIDYRRFIGEFASASAVAAAVAARWAAAGRIPAAHCDGRPAMIGEKAILLIGLGHVFSAVTVRD